MAKKRTSGTQRKPAPVSPVAPAKIGFFEKHKGTIAAIGGLYLLIAVFFTPVVVQQMGLSPAADMVASAGMIRIGADAVSEFRAPLWNPTLFCGIPMFASLQYALFIYPPEYPIRILSYIFGATSYRIWLFHYLLAGIFAYLLARHFRCSRFASWLVGAAYAFSPQLIVLADVGHGSKLMGMTYLPLLWLMMDRLRLKPSLGRATALGLVFATLILALHPQVTAYGALLMVVYLFYYGIDALRKKGALLWMKTKFWWLGSMIMALGLSAVLWLSVLDFSRYSIRGGGGAGEGLSWAYATGWSFHPLESITFLFPKFMGFGGPTYWGTVGTPQGQPFTHNPMYFGCLILLLAALAVLITRRGSWGFPAVLGGTALLLSFGKYFPILFKPLFEYLPLFNKFRAPVMVQVLVMLAAVVMAGMGLDALLRRAREGTYSPRLTRGLWWTMGIAAGLALVTLAGESPFGSIYRSFALTLMPNTVDGVLSEALEMARPDALKSLAFIALITGVAAAALSGRAGWKLLAVAVVGVFLLDLWPINRRMISFTPKNQLAALFQPEGVVKRLSKDVDKFRIHPLDNGYRAANWWSYFGIESTAGYFGAKLANYQKLMTAAGLENWDAIFSHPNLLDALNVRYIITTYPLDALFEELQRQGRGEPVRAVDQYRLEIMPREIRPGAGAFVFRNLNELPRARLVGAAQVEPDFDATIDAMMAADWNPRRQVLLDKPPSPSPQIGGVGKAKIILYRGEEVQVKVASSVPKVLVLADSYYPSGWSATIDGSPAEILRADGVLRGVAVPEGEHTVVFKFRPKSFYLGLWTSVVSAVVMIALGLAAVKFAAKR